MRRFRRGRLCRSLAVLLFSTFLGVFVVGAAPARACNSGAMPLRREVTRRFLSPGEMEAIVGSAPGAPEPWMLADRSSPFTAMRSDGNMTAALPIVGWACRGGMSIDFTLYYNRHETGTFPIMFPGPPPLAYGWTHSYNITLTVDGMTGNVTVREGDGRKHLFVRNGDGTFTRPAGVFDTLVQNGDSTYRLTRHSQVKLNFNGSNKLASLVDLNGNTVSLAFNGSGEIASITDPTGRVLTLAYGANGYISSITDPLNRVWSLQWSGSPEHLWKVVEPGMAGHYVEFGYDGHKGITSIRDRRGSVWQFAYDLSALLTTVTTPLLSERRYLHQVGKVTVTDEAGSNVEYSIGGAGQVTGIVEAPVPGSTQTTSKSYDGDFNVISVTRPGNLTWDYTFDNRGNVLTEEDPITREQPGITKSTHSYNTLNRRTSSTNALGHVVQWFYDVNGNLTQERDPLNYDEFYSGDSYGQRTQRTDRRGKIWRTTYSTHGHVVEQKDPYLATTTIEVNLLGWTTKLIRPTGVRDRFTHDDLGRVVRTIHLNADGTDGPYSERTYNANGQITQLRDENARLTTTVFNAVGWATSITDPGNAVTSFGYNPVGKRTSLTNARNKTTAWTLDGVYRVKLVTYPDATTEELTYAANGQIATRKDGRGNVISHSYDSALRLTGVDYPTGTDVTRTYLANDAPATLTDHTGTYNWSYDARGLVTQAQAPQGTLDLLYDATRQRTNVTRPGIGGTSYGRDDAGRVVSVTNRFTEVTSLTLDAGGRLTQQVNANGTKVLRGYDAARGWVSWMEHRRSDNSLLSRYEHTRDVVGNITRLTATNDY